MRTSRGIFFDMHGVLVDERVLFPQYAQAQAELLAARFGGSRERWLSAYAQMMKVWQKVWRGLELRAPDGMERLKEAWVKMAQDFLSRSGAEVGGEALAWAVEGLPEEAAARCQATFPEVEQALRELGQAGYRLAVASMAMSPYSRGLLSGAGIEAHFSGVFGPDKVGLAYKCPDYYRRAAAAMGWKAQAFAIVDDNLDGIAAAREVGALAVLIDRGQAPGELPGKDQAREMANLILADLSGLARELDRYLPLERRS